MSIAAQRKASVNCDYSRIADVHDQQACVAYILLVSLYETSFATETFTEISWDQAMEKETLTHWNADSPASASIKDFVQRVTDREGRGKGIRGAEARSLILLFPGIGAEAGV